MINNKGKLIKSIPSKCKYYDPDKNKVTKVKCEKLGILYECKNHTGKIEGCLFCNKFIS